MAEDFSTWTKEGEDFSTWVKDESAPVERGLIGETVAGFKRGGLQLLDMGGNIARAVDPEGGVDVVRNAGFGLSKFAKERSQRPDVAESAYIENHPILGNIPKGAEMVIPSIGVPLAIGAGAAAAGVSAPVALGAGAVGAGAFFGASQFQDTKERGIEAGLTPEAASSAGIKTGLIEGGGELLSDVIPFSKVVKLGKPAAGSVLKSVFKAPNMSTAVKRLASDAAQIMGGEVSTEMVQAYAQSVVERDSGIRPDANPFKEAKATIGPTIALSLMMGGVVGGANKLSRVATEKALQNQNVGEDVRRQAANNVYESLRIGEAAGTIPAGSASYWMQNAEEAIASKSPLVLSDDLLRAPVKTATDEDLMATATEALTRAASGESLSDAIEELNAAKVEEKLAQDDALAQALSLEEAPASQELPTPVGNPASPLQVDTSTGELLEENPVIDWLNSLPFKDRNKLIKKATDSPVEAQEYLRRKYEEAVNPVQSEVISNGEKGRGEEVLDQQGADTTAPTFTKKSPVPPPDNPAFLAPVDVKEAADGSFEVTQPKAEPVTDKDVPAMLDAISEAYDNGHAMEDYAPENFGKVDGKVYITDTDSMTPLGSPDVVHGSKEELMAAAQAKLAPSKKTAPAPAPKERHTPPQKGLYRGAELEHDDSGKPQVLAIERPDGVVGFVTPKGDVLATASMGSNGKLSIDIDQNIKAGEAQGYLDAYLEQFKNGLTEDFTPGKGHQNVAAQFGEEVKFSAKGQSDALPTTPNKASDAQVLRLAEKTYKDAAGKPLPAGSLRITKADSALSVRLNKLAAAWGKRVVVYEHDAGVRAPQGFRTGLAIDALFINATTTDPHLVVFGHELAHAIEGESKELYKQFLDVFKAELATDKYAAYVESYNKSHGTNYNGEDMVSEAVAETIGHIMSDPDMWVKLHEKNPTLIERIAAVVVKLLEPFMAGAKYHSQITGRIFNDYSKIQKAAVGMLARYETTREAATGGMKFSAKWQENVTDGTRVVEGTQSSKDGAEQADAGGLYAGMESMPADAVVGAGDRRPSATTVTQGTTRDVQTAASGQAATAKNAQARNTDSNKPLTTGVSASEKGTQNEKDKFTANILAGASGEAQGSNLGTASDELGRMVPDGFYNTAKFSPRARKAKEARVLRAWANKNGLIRDHVAFDETWNAQAKDGAPIRGNEHDVIFNGDGTVTKRNHLPGTYHVSYKELFDRVELFNYLFGGDATLTLTGFQDTPDGLLPEFSQKYLKGAPARIEQTEKMLSGAGFEPVGNKTTAYRLPGTDIIITDVFGENTRQVGDVTVPMDYVIFHGERARSWLKAQEKVELPEFDEAEFDKGFDAAMKFSATEAGTVTVDGVERPAVNSNGKPIHATEEGIRNFWRWFGESKVVDEQGRPLVMTHGSNAKKSFAKFDLKKTRENSLGQGFYFSDIDSHGEAYSGTGIVYSTYLKIENPFVMDWRTDEGRKKSEADGAKIGLSVRGGLWMEGDKKENATKMKKAGYDGVVVLQPETDTFPAHKETVAFSPTQIKSATGNTGAFDGGNPAMKFSATELAEGKNLAKNVTEWFKSFPYLRVLEDSYNTVFRYIMPIDKVINDAAAQESYRPIKTFLLKLLVQKADMAGHLQASLGDGYKVWAAVSKAFKGKDLTALGDLMFKATKYELHAAPDGRSNKWTDASWKEAGMEKVTGKTLGAALAEIRAEYKQVVNTPEKVQAHRDMLDTVHKVYLEAREAQIIVKGQSYDPAVFEAAKKYLDGKGAPESASAEIKEAVADLATIYDDFPMLQGDYMPLMRFGKYAVRTFKIDGDELGERVETRFFKTKQEALDAANKINKKADRKFHAKVEENMEDTRKNVVNIPAAYLDKIKAAAEARFKAAYPNASQEDINRNSEAIEGLVRDAASARASMMPRTSTVGNKIRRESVDGYSTDLAQVFSSYIVSHANANARIIKGASIEQTFRDMKNAINAADSDLKNPADPNDIIKMSNLYNNLYRLEKSSNTEKINAAVKVISKTTFIWYLAASPKVFLVQWSQPFVTTIPLLASRYGFGRAFSEYTAAMRRYMAGKYSDDEIDKFEHGSENAGQRLYDLMAKRRDALPAEIKSLNAQIKALYDDFGENGVAMSHKQELLVLKALSLQGNIDISISHNLGDLVTGADSFDKLEKGVMKYGSFLMQKAETGSRRAAAISSFKLALSQSGDVTQANDYAGYVINETLFDVNSKNRGEMWRGNAGRLFGQFQFFRFHMLGKIIQLHKDAYGKQYDNDIAWAKSEYAKAVESGADSTEAAAERDRLIGEALKTKNEKRKELAYMIGSSFALAGAGGTPIALALGNTATSAFWSAISFMFGDDDDPWDFKKGFADVVNGTFGDVIGTAMLKGLPSLVGWDLSRSIGLGELGGVVMGEPPAGLTGTAKANWYLSRMAGPAAGVFIDGVRAVDEIKDGNLSGALRVGAPKAIKDLFKAAEVSQRGVQAGGKTILQADDVSPYSIALMLSGINPMDVSLAQEESRYVKNLSTEMSQRRSKLIRDVAKANADGEDTGDALAAVSKWTTTHPKLGITAQELASGIKKERKSRLGLLTERERIVKEGA